VGIFGKGDLAVSTSTHFATPLIVVNGPTRTRISLNSTFGALARACANAIGERSVCSSINVGGAAGRDLDVDVRSSRTRHVGENEEASPLAAL
jgi:hypothetical protein